MHLRIDDISLLLADMEGVLCWLKYVSICPVLGRTLFRAQYPHGCHCYVRVHQLLIVLGLHATGISFGILEIDALSLTIAGPKNPEI